MLARSEKDWIFVSDAHFTGRDPDSMEAFLRFLDSEKKRIGYLVILGDLFEFFFGFKNPRDTKKGFAFPEYLLVLRKLQDFSLQGIRIKYFEGNHDFFLNSLFSEQFGIEVDVYPIDWEGRLGEKKVYMSHGDLVIPGQWVHKIFQMILKNRLTCNLIRAVGPRLPCLIARIWTKRDYSKHGAPFSSKSPPPFRTFAHRKFLEGFEIVILGHAHFPEEVEERIDGRKCIYYNVGDWMFHRSFLRFTPPDRFQLERYHEE